MIKIATIALNTFREALRNRILYSVILFAVLIIGASAFSLGINLLQEAQKPKSCPMARRAQDLLLKTQINMPRGGSIDPATARQILGYVTQYLPAAEQMVKSYCK